MQTEIVHWSFERVALQGDAYTSKFLGRRAVFTTYEGGRMVGTVDRVDEMFRPVVVFPEGKWATLINPIELVKD